MSLIYAFRRNALYPHPDSGNELPREGRALRGRSVVCSAEWTVGGREMALCGRQRRKFDSRRSARRKSRCAHGPWFQPFAEGPAVFFWRHRRPGQSGASAALPGGRRRWSQPVRRRHLQPQDQSNRCRFGRDKNIRGNRPARDKRQSRAISRAGRPGGHERQALRRRHQQSPHSHR